MEVSMPKTSRSRKRRPKKASPTRAGTAKTDHEQHVDSCDLEFKESAPTPDAELPAARGGIEIVGSKRRRVR
jgi:hypothetical protein